MIMNALAAILSLSFMGSLVAGDEAHQWSVTEKSKSQKLDPTGKKINVDNHGSASVVVKVLRRDGTLVSETTVSGGSDKDVSWDDSDYEVWVVHDGGDSSGCFMNL